MAFVVHALAFAMALQLLLTLRKLVRRVWHLRFGAHDCIGYPGYGYRIGCQACHQRGFWRSFQR
jgi:hypothetical protein